MATKKSTRARRATPAPTPAPLPAPPPPKTYEQGRAEALGAAVQALSRIPVLFRGEGALHVSIRQNERARLLGALKTLK